MLAGAVVLAVCLGSLSSGGLIPSYGAYWWGVLSGLALGIVLGLGVAPSGVATAAALVWSAAYAWLASLRLVRCEACAAHMALCRPCVLWFSVVSTGAAVAAAAFAIVSEIRRRSRNSRTHPARPM